MAACPEIRRDFLEGAKDEVYELLRELGKAQEKARVVDVAGAAARMEKLHQRLNEIDPHYVYAMGMMGPGADLRSSTAVMAVPVGDVRIEVFPRYRDATADWPITMNLTIALGENDAEIQEALEYGKSVTLPDKVVKGMTLDAPGGPGGDFKDSAGLAPATENHLHGRPREAAGQSAAASPPESSREGGDFLLAPSPSYTTSGDFTAATPTIDALPSPGTAAILTKSTPQKRPVSPRKHPIEIDRNH